MKWLGVAVVALGVIVLAAPPDAAWGQDLKPRVPAAKPTTPLTSIDPTYFHTNMIVVKMREGTGARLRGGGLVAAPGVDVSGLSQALARPSVSMARLFTRPEADLDAERTRGQAASGEQLADLNLYYLVTLDPSVTDPVALVNALNALDVVEIAYPEPIAQPAVVEPPGHTPVDIPPTTPNLQSGQGYLGPAGGATNGVDALWAWANRGFYGAGGGKQWADIEGAWRTDHEDLNLHTTDVIGGQINDIGWRNHGTAVVGVVAGYPNSYGITGIANRVFRTRMSSIGTQSFATAMNNAAAAVGASNAVLIELHAQGPVDPNNNSCICNCGQFRFIAMEYWQANFDAIKAATANGVIVVEAAGNGSMNLDAAVYGNAFNRSVRDSWAIVVGAGLSNNRAPHCWTNFGSRVDVQGWGDSVRTTGYGGIAFNGNDERQWYTSGFSGTSSASPIVTGSALVLQAVSQGYNLLTLHPLTVRSILRNTGTAQAASAKQIGPLPDLRNAILNGIGKCTEGWGYVGTMVSFDLHALASSLAYQITYIYLYSSASGGSLLGVGYVLDGLPFGAGRQTTADGIVRQAAMAMKGSDQVYFQGSGICTGTWRGRIVSLYSLRTDPVIILTPSGD